MIRFAACVFVVLLGLSRVALAQVVPIDALLALPHVSDISGAPDGGAVAWVENVKGARNVWVAAAPELVARRLTASDADDGQDVTLLHWSPDARHILFVRGGEANRQGESANPANVIDGTEQAIWIVPAAGGVPRRVAAGSQPAASATGLLAFVSRGQIWGVPMEGGMPRQLFVGRGQPRELRWSPDGRRLAFSSRRDGHAFIGVYDTTTTTVTYVDAGLAVDTNPTWAADSRRLAFIRVPAAPSPTLFRQHRVDTPWSIRIVDVVTGTGRARWTADPGPGSVFTRLGSSYESASGPPQLFWGADDRLVFPWERDGWIHLYSMAADAGDPQLLTPGEFEVQHAVLSLDRRTIYFSSNEDDPDRRHIWSVAAAGGMPRRLTTGDGIEVLPVALRDGAVGYLRSDARTPARPMVRTATGDVQDLQPAARPASDLAQRMVVPQPVTFKASDGFTVHAQLFLPADLRPGERRPALAYFHGGPWNQMLLGWHWTASYHFTYALNQHLVSRGFIVLSVNFRSGPGYGLDFREPAAHGAGGASEVNDIIASGTYLKNRPDVDARRMGIWGNSFGGYMAAQGLVRAPDLFAAGVNVHGVIDWNAAMRMFAPGYTAPPDVARRAFESSPLAHLDAWRAPVLLVHGDDDRNVAFSQTVMLADRLARNGVPFEALVLPNEVHAFLRYDSWRRIFAAAAGFFERTLGTAGGGS